MRSWILVLAQFTLAAYLVLSTRWSPFPWIAVSLAIPGAVLAIWAWVRVGLRNIRIHPDVTERTELVTSGPYAVVRHPMYSGLLWFTLPLLSQPFRVVRVAAWIGLVAVLYVKTRHEEASMREHFESYGDYRQRVGGLVPRSPRRRA